MLFGRRREYCLTGLWLALAAVLAHALLPVGSPLSPRTGSAFSFATVDVAVRPGRSLAPGKSAVAASADDGLDGAEDGDPPIPVALSLVPPTEAMTTPPPAPPAADRIPAVFASPLGPRAPPAV